MRRMVRDRGLVRMGKCAHYREDEGVGEGKGERSEECDVK